MFTQFTIIVFSLFIDHTAKREFCTNTIPVEDCFDAFTENKYSCYSVQFKFEEKCREFCEFCVPNRSGDAPFYWLIHHKTLAKDTWLIEHMYSNTVFTKLHILVRK